MHLLSMCRGFPSHISLSHSLSLPLILSLILIFPSSLLSFCFSNVENAASPLPSPWLFTSPKIKWASLSPSLSLSLSLPNYSTQSHTPNAGFTIIKLFLSTLTQTLFYLLPPHFHLSFSFLASVIIKTDQRFCVKS